MGTNLIDPRDVAAGTGDRAALGTPWAERPPVHLNADNDSWSRLPAWIDIPLRPLMTEHPAASIAAVGSLAVFVIALAML